MESNKLLKDLFLTMRNDYAGWDAKQKRHTSWEVCRCFGRKLQSKAVLWNLRFIF